MQCRRAGSQRAGCANRSVARRQQRFQRRLQQQSKPVFQLHDVARRANTCVPRRRWGSRSELAWLPPALLDSFPLSLVSSGVLLSPNQQLVVLIGDDASGDETTPAGAISMFQVAVGDSRQFNHRRAKCDPLGRTHCAIRVSHERVGYAAWPWASTVARRSAALHGWPHECARMALASRRAE